MGGDKNVFFHIKINWKENINSKVKRGLLEERQLEKEKIDEVTFGRIQIMGWKENRRDRKKQTNDETKRQTTPPLLFRCLFFFSPKDSGSCKILQGYHVFFVSALLPTPFPNGKHDVSYAGGYRANGWEWGMRRDQPSQVSTLR